MPVDEVALRQPDGAEGELSPVLTREYEALRDLMGIALESAIKGQQVLAQIFEFGISVVHVRLMRPIHGLIILDLRYGTSACKAQPQMQVTGMRKLTVIAA